MSNAFDSAKGFAIDKFHEDLRKCDHWQPPNRVPRETLLNERVKVTTIKVRNSTPPNVLLGRALGLTAKCSTDATNLLPTVKRLIVHEPMQQSAPPVQPVPRFYRWRPGAKSEDECQPVY